MQDSVTVLEIISSSELQISVVLPSPTPVCVILKYNVLKVPSVF